MILADKENWLLGAKMVALTTCTSDKPKPKQTCMPLILYEMCIMTEHYLFAFIYWTKIEMPIWFKGCVAQSVTCLATDASLTADPGVTSSIPVRSHTFVEIAREMISTVILLPSADSFKKGCCQLQAKVCARITG